MVTEHVQFVFFLMATCGYTFDVLVGLCLCRSTAYDESFIDRLPSDILLNRLDHSIKFGLFDRFHFWLHRVKTTPDLLNKSLLDGLRYGRAEHCADLIARGAVLPSTVGVSSPEWGRRNTTRRMKLPNLPDATFEARRDIVVTICNLPTTLPEDALGLVITFGVIDEIPRKSASLIGAWIASDSEPLMTGLFDRCLLIGQERLDTLSQRFLHQYLLPGLGVSTPDEKRLQLVTIARAVTSLRYWPLSDQAYLAGVLGEGAWVRELVPFTLTTPSDVRFRDTLLWAAGMCGDVESVKKLMPRGARLYSAWLPDYLPMGSATVPRGIRYQSRHETTDLIRYLIKHRTSIIADECALPRVPRQLLEKNFLSAAVRAGLVEETRVMIREGYDWSTIEDDNPVCIAVSRDDHVMVGMLADEAIRINDPAMLNGAVNGNGILGYTIRFFAYYRPREEGRRLCLAMCELLISLNAPIEGINNNGENTALVHAIKSADVALIRLLITHGASVNVSVYAIETDSMISALHSAVDLTQDFTDDDHPTSLLLAAGANVNALDDEGYTPIMRTVMADGREQSCRILLRDPQLQIDLRASNGDEDGPTVLLMATWRGRYELAVQLVTAGADGSLRDSDNLTALEIIAENPIGVHTTRMAGLSQCLALDCGRPAVIGHPGYLEQWCTRHNYSNGQKFGMSLCRVCFLTKVVYDADGLCEACNPTVQNRIAALAELVNLLQARTCQGW